MQGTVTAAEIQTYLSCPRKYEFEHERHLSPPADDLSRIKQQRTQQLQLAIKAGWQNAANGEKGMISAALNRLEENRSDSEDEYLSESQATFDRAAVTAAIESYFETLGSEHGDNLEEIDTTLSHESEGVTYEINVDALLKEGSKYKAVAIQPNLWNIVPTWAEDTVRDYLAGEAFYPGSVSSLVRAELAIKGLYDEFGIDINPRFVVVAPLENVEPAYKDDQDPTVEPASRDLTRVYEKQKSAVESLRSDIGERINQADTDPRSSGRPVFRDIQDRSCRTCSYENACPDAIATDTAFAHPTESGTDEARTNPIERPNEPQSGDKE